MPRFSTKGRLSRSCKQNGIGEKNDSPQKDCLKNETPYGKRRRLENEDESSPMIVSPLRTRSRTRSVSFTKGDDDREKLKHSGGRTNTPKNFGRTATPETDDSEVSARRSLRTRREVYGTLNEKDLVCSLFTKNIKNPAITDLKKKGSSRRGVLEEETDHSEDEEKRRQHGGEDEEEEGDGGEDSDDDDGEEGSDEEETDEEEEEEEEGHGRYHLRTHKPITKRYMAPPIQSGEKRRLFIHDSPIRKISHHSSHASPIKRRYRRHRKAMNMSSSSTSDDSDDDARKFERRKSKSMAKARERCLPMNLRKDDLTGVLGDRERVGASLADIDPMSIDSKVTFESVGGLGQHVRALKEMVVFPLLYPEVFEKFKLSPPRGVLFHGPPGTGKTLVARALANECSQEGRKVAFFMRKGADCLSKWVGESERQLRLLFDQAYTMRPSIIFFDEIDGLAPVRSSRQDQIHSSIVSTLLALMDGLDSRGEVIVIGATNRIDAIDPALRRPGRFDREFPFSLPDREARQSIVAIHTKDWQPKLSQAFIKEIADNTVGYCGADIKALGTEAALFALRRRYPQIYATNKKLVLDVNSIEIKAKDFYKAMKSIVPASQRSVVCPGQALPVIVKPLLQREFEDALGFVQRVFPSSVFKTEGESTCTAIEANTSSHNNARYNDSSSDDDGCSIFETPDTSRGSRYNRRTLQRGDELRPPPKFLSFADNPNQCPPTHRPRLLLTGRQGMGQTTHIAPALLHSMEHLTVHCLDLPALFGVASKTPEEACAQIFREARRTSPCVLYLPHVTTLWAATTDTLKATFLTLLEDLPPLAPVFVLATTDERMARLPIMLLHLFNTRMGQVLEINYPNAEERRRFFEVLFLKLAIMEPVEKPQKKQQAAPEVLAVAPSPPTRQLGQDELQKIHEYEDDTMRELRIFLRDITIKLLSERRFKEFTKPVDLEEVPDYLDVIKKPMDLSTLLYNIDSHQYSTCAEFLQDLSLITSNALEYNPDRDAFDKMLRHRACTLKDMAHSLVKSQLDPEFEKSCQEIIEARKTRGEQRGVTAPQFISVAPLVSMATTSASTSASTSATTTVPSLQFSVQLQPLTLPSHYPVRLRSMEASTPPPVLEDGTNTDKTLFNPKQHELCPDSSIRRRKKKSRLSNRKKGKIYNQHAGNGGSNIVTSTTDTTVIDQADDCQEKSPLIVKMLDNDEENEESDASGPTLKPQTGSVIAQEECDLSEDEDNIQDEIEERIEHATHQPVTPETGLIETPSPMNEEIEVELVVSCGSKTAHKMSELQGVKDELVENSLTLVNSEEKENDDNDVPARRTREQVKEEQLSQYRRRLQELLDELVQITEYSTIECLECYYTSMRQCIYSHRKTTDKDLLIKELENVIKEFANSKTSRDTRSLSLASLISTS